MIASQGACAGECCLRRLSRHDGVRASGVDVDRNPTVMVVDASRVNDTSQHGALGVGDLLAKDFQVCGLRMATVAEGMANRCKVLRAAVRAGEHDDRPDPGESPAPGPR